MIELTCNDIGGVLRPQSIRVLGDGGLGYHESKPTFVMATSACSSEHAMLI